MSFHSVLHHLRRYRFTALFLGLIAFAVFGYQMIPAPRVVGAELTGEVLKVTFKAPVTLHFTQRMNKESVEKAFSAEPELKGGFTWPNGHTLEFYPENPLKIGQEFRITVGASAKSLYRKPLGEDAELSFLVTGAPFVQFISPRLPESQVPIVGPSQPVTVMFNRPMEIAEGAALAIDPPMEGRYRRLGESAFQFIPKAWVMSTRYKLTVLAGIVARDGGATEKEEVFYLETPKSRIIEITPPPITVRFNQPVELGAVQPGKNIQLFPSNDVDAEKHPKNDGFFNMEATYALDADGRQDKTSLIFTPTFPYRPGQEYRFVVQGDKNEFSLGITERAELKFKVKAQPSAEGSQPVSSAGLSWSDGKDWEFVMIGDAPRFRVKSDKADALEIGYCPVTASAFFVWKGDGAPCTLQTKTVPLSSKESQETDLDFSSLFEKTEWEKGLYFTSVTAKGVEEASIHKMFAVSDTALVLKKSGSEALVWAVDLKTGAPVARMELAFLSHEGEEIGKGVTDGDGIYKMASEFGEGIYVIGKKELEKESRWAIAGQYWSYSADTDFGEGFALLEPRVYFFLSRSSARAGENLDFKGVVRIDNDAELSLPKIVQADVVLEDEEGSEATRLTVPFRRDGSFDGIMPLSEELKPGAYRLSAISDGTELGSTSFNIIGGEPPFSLDWANVKKNYKAGEVPMVDLIARYPYGLPAAHITGEWQLYRKPFSFGSETESGYSYGVTGVQDNRQELLVAKGETTFDANGRARFSLTNGEGKFLEAGYEYRLNVAARDFNEETAFVALNFRVHPGAYYIGINAKRLLMRPDENLETSIVATSYDGEIMEGKKIKLSLVSQRKEWFSKTFLSAKEPVEVSVPATRDMPGGIYLLRAQSQDADGNEVVAEKQLFLITPEGEVNVRDFMFVPDQSIAYVGGKARFLAVAPDVSQEKPATLLVTFERAGILAYQVVSLMSPLTPVEVLVDDNMVPNVYVKAQLIQSYASHPKDEEQEEREIKSLLEGDTKTQETSGALFTWKQSVTSLRISRREQEIKVDLSFDPLAPQPGQKVKVKIHTYDYKNVDVPAAVALSVTQKSQEPGILDYFLGIRPLQVTTATSLEPKDIAGAPATISENAVDAIELSSLSAYFNPVIATDKGGRAEVEFDLPSTYAGWEVSAAATENSNRFGQKQIALPVDSRALITPIIPANALPGDKITLGALITNTSGKDIGSRLEITAEGLVFPEGPKKDFAVKAGQSIQVLWQAEIPATENRGQVTVNLKSRDDAANTALQIKRPPDAAVMGDPERQIREAAAKLRELQREDGGYFYWKGAAASDSTLSSYALYALNFAKQKGDAVPDETLEKTARYLIGKMADKNLSADEKIVMLWALGDYGQYDTAASIELFNTREEATPYGRLLLLIAMEKLVDAGQKSIQPYVERLKSELNPTYPLTLRWFGDGGSLPSPLGWLLGEISDFVAQENGAVLSRLYCRLEDTDCKEPVTEMKAGEVYAGSLTLVLPQDITRAFITEPMPAGILPLAVGVSIRSLSSQYQQEEMAKRQGFTFLDNPIWNFNDRSVQKDKLLLYAENLPAGVYTIDYLVQAGLSGSYYHPPATFKVLGQSDIGANTEGGKVEIK